MIMVRLLTKRMSWIISISYRFGIGESLRNHRVRDFLDSKLARSGILVNKFFYRSYRAPWWVCPWMRQITFLCSTSLLSLILPEYMSSFLRSTVVFEIAGPIWVKYIFDVCSSSSGKTPSISFSISSYFSKGKPYHIFVDREMSE